MINGSCTHNWTLNKISTLVLFEETSQVFFFENSNFKMVNNWSRWLKDVIDDWSLAHSNHRLNLISSTVTVLVSLLQKMAGKL